jgi:hypothetical protein
MAWISRLRALFGKEKLAKEQDEELAFHLSMREQWNVEPSSDRGLPKRSGRGKYAFIVSDNSPRGGSTCGTCLWPRIIHHYD